MNIIGIDVSKAKLDCAWVLSTRQTFCLSLDTNSGHAR